MGPIRLPRRLPRPLLGSALLLTALLGPLSPATAQAGPLVRRAQERKACQLFATRLQQSAGNPAMAQQVYQQGVLQLVSRFGENPCTDIPAPVAGPVTAPTTPSAAPSARPAAATTPATSAPAATPAASTTTPAAPTAGQAPAAAAPSAQQQQACQQFAAKLQAAAASGGSAAAQQTYAMGQQKLSGMFGANPCPAVRPPQ